MRVLTSFIVFFVAISSIVAQSYTSYFTGNNIDAIAEDLAFTLTVMGGGTEVDYAMKLFLEDARGGDVLVLRTSGSDGYNDYLYSELGVNVNSVETIVCHNPNASYDPYVLDRILKAEAVWFAGGDQWEYLSYWRGTPLQQYLNFAILDKGMPVGGTSAGMAIMGQYQFTAENGTVTSEQALADPYNDRMTIDNRPFLIMPLPLPIIFDSHFDERERRGRMVAFLARIEKDYQKTALGIGVDEKTAVRIKDGILTMMDDSFTNGATNGCHLFIVDCDAESQEFIVEEGEPLTWSEDRIRHTKVVSGPTDVVNIDLVSKAYHFSPYEDNYVTINTGVYEEESASLLDEYSFSCWVISDTEDQPNQQISISPNPVINTLKIDKVGLIISGLEITAQNGRVVKVLDVDTDVVDLSQLSSGVYFLKVLTGNKQLVRKFVKL